MVYSEYENLLLKGSYCLLDNKLTICDLDKTYVKSLADGRSYKKYYNQVSVPKITTSWNYWFHHLYPESSDNIVKFTLVEKKNYRGIEIKFKGNKFINITKASFAPFTYEEIANYIPLTHSTNLDKDYKDFIDIVKSYYFVWLHKIDLQWSQLMKSKMITGDIMPLFVIFWYAHYYITNGISSLVFESPQNALIHFRKQVLRNEFPNLYTQAPRFVFKEPSSIKPSKEKIIELSKHMIFS
jgi:hypothetical protein